MAASCLSTVYILRVFLVLLDSHRQLFLLHWASILTLFFDVQLKMSWGLSPNSGSRNGLFTQQLWAALSRDAKAKGDLVYFAVLSSRVHCTPARN